MNILYLKFEDGGAIWINLTGVVMFARSTAEVPHTFTVELIGGEKIEYAGVTDWDVI